MLINFLLLGEYASAIDSCSILLKRNFLIPAMIRLNLRLCFCSGKLHTAMEDFELAMNALDMSKSLGISDQLLNPEISKLETALITSAVGDNETENFSSAAKKPKWFTTLIKIIMKSIFYAASSAVNSLDYPLALEYYEILRDIKYEGIETKFYITEVSSGNEIEINSETEFKLLQSSRIT